jgi:predicted phosphodiesterase
VRIAILADIHANREAFTACLTDAQRRGVTPAILLGDYVGYGADPKWSRPSWIWSTTAQ